MKYMDLFIPPQDCAYFKIEGDGEWLKIRQQAILFLSPSSWNVIMLPTPIPTPQMTSVSINSNYSFCEPFEKMS